VYNVIYVIKFDNEAVVSEKIFFTLTKTVLVRCRHRLRTFLYSLEYLELLYKYIVEDARASAEDMDEERRRDLSYLYLCHLEEAKK